MEFILYKKNINIIINIIYIIYIVILVIKLI